MKSKILTNQRVNRRGKASRLKRIAKLAGFITSASVLGGALGSGAYKVYTEARIQRAWDKLVTKYGDIDEEVGVSDREKDALFKRVLRTHGMAYDSEKGILYYPAIGKKASERDLLDALENYTQPTVFKREVL